MTIREVFTAKDIQDFHGVLDVVYAGDDGFIYPIKSDVEAVFDVNKNKSFSNGAARLMRPADGPAASLHSIL